MVSSNMDNLHMKSSVPQESQPPSYERASSPSANAPSTYNGEFDTGPRALQPDNTYPNGSQNFHQPNTMTPPPAGGYYQPPPLQQPQAPPAAHQGSFSQHQQQPQQTQYQQPQQPQHQQAPAGATSQGQQFKNVTPLYALTSSSSPVECPACGARSLTRTTLKTGNTTHAWAAGVCFLTCLGCIPYCVSGTKDVEHKCGNCGCTLATWHRSGRTEAHMHG